MKYVIKKPTVTEKSSIKAEEGVYTFEVAKKATKTDIKKAIETGFDVKVASVKTMICRGRAKKTSAGASLPRCWKKAMVKLKDGEQIKLFEGGNN